MFTGYGIGQPAQITFTLDYHELVHGDLKAGAKCHINYDPRRIVLSDSNYTHGDPNQPIVAHIQFQENSPEELLQLWSPVGLVKDLPFDPTGVRSALLVQDIDIPEYAEELIIWFNYVNPDTSETYVDNDYGQKFRFRWPYHDVQIQKADVINLQNATSNFELEVKAVSKITQVFVRWSLVNSVEPISAEVALTNTGSTEESGYKIWFVSAVVPHYSIVKFKLFYIINGQRYKNDNASNYFFAPEPKPIQAPPPPTAPIRI